MWPKTVHNHIRSSLDEIHHSTVDEAVNLCKLFGGDGFNDMNPGEINALIDAH